ncbi:hypothetical protein QZM93_05875 [Burkholderia cepacia]|uniref:hypothetical protein n=1 Tax=Burkholderia cepacia TaxID=292 RepID=UPI002653E64D|nr:hypothetical protein [Burkholderia cepacia]MDN7888139.1 hypothetical protein [Burkholderia cepacia]
MIPDAALIHHQGNAANLDATPRERVGLGRPREAQQHLPTLGWCIGHRFRGAAFPGTIEQLLAFRAARDAGGDRGPGRRRNLVDFLGEHARQCLFFGISGTWVVVPPGIGPENLLAAAHVLLLRPAVLADRGLRRCISVRGVRADGGHRADLRRRDHGSINDHPDIRRVFEGFEMEKASLNYTVGKSGRDAARGELIVYSGDRAAAPAGLFQAMR